MKRIASIGLILLMSLQCFYQLGVITYFQLNQNYIAEVLCINKEKPVTMCYGQCFLEETLKFGDTTASDDNGLPIGLQRTDLPIFLITENFYSFPEINQRVANNSRYLSNSSSAHYSAPFHPPALLA